MCTGCNKGIRLCHYITSTKKLIRRGLPPCFLETLNYWCNKLSDVVINGIMCLVMISCFRWCQTRRRLVACFIQPAFWWFNIAVRTKWPWQLYWWNSFWLSMLMMRFCWSHTDKSTKKWNKNYFLTETMKATVRTLMTKTVQVFAPGGWFQIWITIRLIPQVYVFMGLQVKGLNFRTTTT